MIEVFHTKSHSGYDKLQLKGQRIPLNELMLQFFFEREGETLPTELISEPKLNPEKGQTRRLKR